MRKLPVARHERKSSQVPSVAPPQKRTALFSAPCAIFARSFLALLPNVQVLTTAFSSAHALFVKSTREGDTPKSILPGIRRLATHRPPCSAVERKSPVRGVAREARLRIVAVSKVERLPRCKCVEAALPVTAAREPERKSTVRGAFAVSKSGLLVTAWAIAYNLGFFGCGNSHSCEHSQRDF
jgi:hypothetical protein